MGGTWRIICVIPPSLILPPSVAVIQIHMYTKLHLLNNDFPICTYNITDYKYVQGKIKKNKKYQK